MTRDALLRGAPARWPFDLFTLSAPVGPGAANRPVDVARLEALLAASGHLDPAPAGGLTGAFGRRVESALRRFQTGKGLRMDGLANPGGPTVTALQRAHGGAEGFAGDVSAIQGAIPQMPAEDFGDLRRTARAALAGTTFGDLPRFAGEAFRTGSKGRMEVIELIGLVADEDAEAGARLRREVAGRIDRRHRPLLYSGELVRALSDQQEKANIKAREEGAAEPAKEEPRTSDPVAQSGAAPGREPAPDGEGGGAGEQKPGPSDTTERRIVKVPEYRKKTVPQEAMDRFSGRHGDAGPNLFNALGEIFAAEGGFKADPESSAFAGITDGALEDARKIDPDLKGGGKARDLSEAQVAKAYRAYMKGALGRYGGENALETIADRNTAAAFADTLFVHGKDRGARIIKRATNEVIKNLSEYRRRQLGVSELHAGTGPKDTLKAIRRLEAGKLDKELRNEIANFRIAETRDKRIKPRIDHFRF